MNKVFENLDESMKAKLDGLKAIHNLDFFQNSSTR